MSDIEFPMTIQTIDGVNNDQIVSLDHEIGNQKDLDNFKRGWIINYLHYNLGTNEAYSNLEQYGQIIDFDNLTLSNDIFVNKGGYYDLDSTALANDLKKATFSAERGEGNTDALNGLIENAAAEVGTQPLVSAIIASNIQTGKAKVHAQQELQQKFDEAAKPVFEGIKHLIANPIGALIDFGIIHSDNPSKPTDGNNKLPDKSEKEMVF
jgi:hypothetical protein